MIAKFWLRTCLPLCAALIVLASPATAQQSPPVETIFQNVRVLDVVKGEVGPATDVVVRGNRIASITSSAKAASGAKIIDGKGHTLMPGLIDAHVHFGFGSLLLTQLYDPKTTPETLSAAMTNSAKQMLLRGFTAARDMGGPIFPLKRAIDAGNAGPAHLALRSCDLADLRSWRFPRAQRTLAALLWQAIARGGIRSNLHR